MPKPGKAWYHVTIGTYASWLPGDKRGFRTRNHRLHSSGDHLARPPREEHAGLRRHHEGQCPTIIPAELRAPVGQKLVDHLDKLGHELLVMAVGGMHVHLLAELPRAFGEVDHEIGRCKQAASLLVASQIDRKLWAKGCGVRPIKDHAHQRNVYRYIKKHAQEGAWVWTFREGQAVENDL